jgi:hypothetical protein
MLNVVQYLVLFSFRTTFQKLDLFLSVYVREEISYPGTQECVHVSRRRWTLQDIMNRVYIS